MPCRTCTQRRSAWPVKPDEQACWKQMLTLAGRAMSAQAGVKLAILRPSIVTSCALEPLPGWLEGLKVADPLIIASAKGRSPGFAGAP